jgi:putative membrane protein
MNFLINLLISSLAVFASARVIPGVVIDNFTTSVIVAIILGVVNAIIKPILIILTLPINIMTLGLFTLVINAVVVLIVDALVPGFSVSSFVSALLFSIVLSVVSLVLFTIAGE